MKTTIKFHAIDTISRTDLPLYLSTELSCFNDVASARLAGKYYKAVLDDRNIVTFYFRDKSLSHLTAHRYIVAMDWHRTDKKLVHCNSTTANNCIVERILRQRLLHMVKIINTSNL